MTDIFRIVIEKYNDENPKEINREIIEERKIDKAVSIIDLGFRHNEQIILLQKIQDQLLAGQAIHMREAGEYCPKCNNKVRLDGSRNSIFHSVFTDHKVKITRLRCGSCGYRSTPTVSSIFGTNIHPDLAKMQVENGAEYSYRGAENILNQKSCNKRTVNNHVSIKSITENVGLAIEEKEIVIPLESMEAKELIMQVDGGHVRSFDKTQRSFEALTTTIYSPANIRYLEKGKRGIITSKHCAASALSDTQESIKINTLKAAQAGGMTKNTNITALCDGAANCWNVVRSLIDYCAKITSILDWFHIAMKFQNISLAKTHKEKLIKIKWCIWHGNIDKALEKFDKLHATVSVKSKAKILSLKAYIENNKDYIVNYDERKNSGLIFTSNLAESTVESLINQRCKGQQHMLWSRAGLHAVLQVRAAISSKYWPNIWQDVTMSALCKKAA
jgi:hypothetical protein